MPVRELEGRIDCLGGAEGLLSGDGATEYVAVAQTVIFGKRGHEVGCLLHEVVILIQHGVVGVGAIEQLGQIDEVGLLPDQERAYL